ncbi:MAG: wyosine base formation [Acidobacteria bacterium]|nr:MAG: wyosine base formation [Acidobacteriota bacterium]
MDQTLDALAAETAGLSSFLEQLTDDQWRHPSACAGWSVSDVVLHLAQSEEGVISAFDHGSAGIPLAPYAKEAVSGGGGAVDGIVEAAVRAERPTIPADVLPRWQEAHAGVMRRFREAEPGARLNWISVPLSPRTLATTRIAEHWIHGMDIREPLGDPAPDTDRLELIARLAWRTLGYAFGSVGEVAPSVALRLEGPEGEAWKFGSDDAEVVITGPAGDWCRVAARRLDPGESSLIYEGTAGKRVLELVRTYA